MFTAPVLVSITSTVAVMFVRRAIWDYNPRFVCFLFWFVFCLFFGGEWHVKLPQSSTLVSPPHLPCLPLSLFLSSVWLFPFLFCGSTWLWLGKISRCALSTVAPIRECNLALQIRMKLVFFFFFFHLVVGLAEGGWEFFCLFGVFFRGNILTQAGFIREPSMFL